MKNPPPQASMENFHLVKNPPPLACLFARSFARLFARLFACLFARLFARSICVVETSAVCRLRSSLQAALRGGTIGTKVRLSIKTLKT